MRFALAIAFAIVFLPASAKSQSARMDALSLRFGQQPTVATKSLVWQPGSKTGASIGGHRHVARGAAIGFLVGAVAGVAYGHSAKPGEMGRGYNETVGAIGFGGVGAALGAIAGYAWRSKN